MRSFMEPQNVFATAVLTTLCLGFVKIYKGYLRRIPEATNIHQSYFRKRSIFGKVTSVGDGDNFRIYHTPGGWLAGWGWVPWRRVPVDRKSLKDKTVRVLTRVAAARLTTLQIHIRIAGIDAPELAHFGRPAQPHSQDALKWLTSYVLGRRVRAYVYKLDQYSRVVATVYVRKGIFKRDVGLQMIKTGLATVYEAKSGAEFGEGLEAKYRDAEWWAQTKKKGMWSGKAADFESPRQYKAKHSGKGLGEETKLRI